MGNHNSDKSLITDRQVRALLTDINIGEPDEAGGLRVEEDVVVGPVPQEMLHLGRAQKTGKINGSCPSGFSS